MEICYFQICESLLCGNIKVCHGEGLALTLPILIAIKASKIKPTRDEIEIQGISLMLSIHSVFSSSKAITSLTINLTGIISGFNKYH